MILLAIDTSGPVAGVCLYRDGTPLAELAAFSGLTHSESLLPMVEETLCRAGLRPEEIDLFAVVTGPGSFTGVRIGVSFVKGLAHSLNRPCVGVNALEALAACHGTSGALLCPLQDARAGQVYAAVFEGEFPPKRLLPDQAIRLEEFLSQAREMSKGRKLLFTGDGVKPNQAKILELLGDEAIFPPSHMTYLRPAAVAALAWEKRAEAVDYLTLMPVYLRPPQAVRLRERMEAARP